MKKSVFAIGLLCVLLCGCQLLNASETITLRIVDGAETGQLVLAGENAADVYTINANDVTVHLDGEKTDVSALEDGMMAEIVCSGGIQETWPASFDTVRRIDVYSLGSVQNPAGGLYDLCGLYLQVLNDLWAKDAALNEDITYISVDLSSAPGELTKGEQAAIAWIFASTHDATPLTLSAEQLAEEGYLTEITGSGCGIDMENRASNIYCWEDGVLFYIIGKTAGTEQYSLPIIQFDAGKWRSPLGAYWFGDCTAVWPEVGSWNGYTVKHELIS